MTHQFLFCNPSFNWLDEPTIDRNRSAGHLLTLVNAGRANKDTFLKDNDFYDSSKTWYKTVELFLTYPSFDKCKEKLHWLSPDTYRMFPLLYERFKKTEEKTPFPYFGFDKSCSEGSIAQLDDWEKFHYQISALFTREERQEHKD